MEELIKQLRELYDGDTAGMTDADFLRLLVDELDGGRWSGNTSTTDG